MKYLFILLIICGLIVSYLMINNRVSYKYEVEERELYMSIHNVNDQTSISEVERLKFDLNNRFKMYKISLVLVVIICIYLLVKYTYS
jgi:hypothetical protein